MVQELGWAPLLSKRAQADLAPRPSKTTEQKKTLRSPGIEPGSITWQATIITTRPRTLIVTPTPPSAHNLGYEAPLTQSVECWSYEPKVAGSSPAWSTDFCKASTGCKYKKKIMAVPGFEPGSSGSQPLMLTTTLYHHGWETKCRLVMMKTQLPDLNTSLRTALFVGEIPPLHAIQLL